MATSNAAGGPRYLRARWAAECCAATGDEPAYAVQEADHGGGQELGLAPSQTGQAVTQHAFARDSRPWRCATWNL